MVDAAEGPLVLFEDGVFDGGFRRGPILQDGVTIAAAALYEVEQPGEIELTLTGGLAFEYESHEEIAPDRDARPVFGVSQ